VPDMRAKATELVRTSIYQRLRADILSCKLRPGLQLQEKDLVEQFSVSKSPIRDALLKLDELGLVEVLPRKGYRVRRIDVSDVRDMYEMRQIFERESICLLIDNAPEDLLRGLDRFRTGPEASEDLPVWVAYNRSFHSWLAANCGNARLARSALETIEQFDRLTYVSVSHVADMALGSFVAEHGAIIDAIQARKRRQATALARDHIESSRRRVLDELAAVSVIDTTPESSRS